MDNKKTNYNVWLAWSVTAKCNLDCVYCYSKLSQQKKPIFEKALKVIRSSGILGLFTIFRNRLKRAMGKDRSKKIDIPSLIRALGKTKKIFRIDFLGGGEPFLIPNLIEACEEITKKHYIGFNTNLTSERIKEFCERIDPSRVIQIVASTHIKELERLDLLDRYIFNFLMCRDKGFNVFSIEVAHPSLLAEAWKYREFFKGKGIELAFAPFIGEYDGKQYPQAYTDEEIKVFGLNKTFEGNIGRFYQKGQFCNAGYNVAVVDPCGNIMPCLSINKIIGNIYSEAGFGEELIKCPFEFCVCPLNYYDQYLFTKAMEEQGGRLKYR